MTRYGMLIDLSRCSGCNACTISCKAYNATPQGVSFIHVGKSESGKFPDTKAIFLPRACMHCKDAPCVKACPTHAMSKRGDGIVTLDRGRCIGCRYCVAACPFDALTYVSEIQSYYGNSNSNLFEQVGYAQRKVGTVAKCEFCVTRVDQGYQPACVQTCPLGARMFGDLEDPNSEISQLISSSNAVQLLSQRKTDPSVYYVMPTQQQTPVTAEQQQTLLKISASPDVVPLTLINEAKDWIKPLAVVAIGGVVLGTAVNMVKSNRDHQEKVEI